MPFFVVVNRPHFRQELTNTSSNKTCLALPAELAHLFHNTLDLIHSEVLRKRESEGGGCRGAPVGSSTGQRQIERLTSRPCMCVGMCVVGDLVPLKGMCVNAPLLL